MSSWPEARDAATLAAPDLENAGLVFRVDDRLYRTTGEHVGSGGMGHAYFLERRENGRDEADRAVGKIYRWEYLVQIAKDADAGRHYAHNLEVLSRIQGLRDLHVLPIFESQPIVDNHLVVTPFAGEAFVSLLARGALDARAGLGLLVQAVRGLRVLHDRGIVHGDFTPRNVLVAERADGNRQAILFDFDLSLALDRLGGATYADHYRGRLVGSPEWSLTPEQVDPDLEQQPLSPRRDVYAVGTFLWSLFADTSVYGSAGDLPSLLEAIGEGVVLKGRPRVEFPTAMPAALREVAARCLERDPADRYPDGTAVLRALELAAGELGGGDRRIPPTTLTWVQVPRPGLKDIFDKRPDVTIELDEIRENHAALARAGYVLERSLGRVKDHLIFLARPDPIAVASGRTRNAGAWPKLVTSIDLRRRPDADAFIELWLGRIVPILEQVRRSCLTALHRVVVDRPSGRLLLFSEYLEDPRFGQDLARHDLFIEEVLALGLVLCHQVARLHSRGLAHNHICLESLLFKRVADSRQVRPVLVGLVNPSVAPEALENDVRRLADLIAGLVRPTRLALAPGPAVASIEVLLEHMRQWARGDGTPPRIGELFDLMGEALAMLDHNFEVILRHGGDPPKYAEMLLRHALHRYLWG